MKIWILACGAFAVVAARVVYNLTHRQSRRSSSLHRRSGQQRVARHCEDSRGSPVTAEQRAFGERLRRQRRQKDLSLTEIAASTKVGATHYAALERGDCSRWPGGVYNRAFIRAYAKAVGLDPEEIAAEFAEYFEAAPAPASIAQTESGEPETTARPPAPSRHRTRSLRDREAPRPDCGVTDR